MSRSKSKIAVTLLGALAFGANAQAMNSGVKDVKSEQTIGAVGGARNQHKKINWQKIAKIGGFSVAGLAALETIHSIIGGVTDSKLGSFSIGRAIRNRIKKNEQLSNQGNNPEMTNNERSDNQGENNPKVIENNPIISNKNENIDNNGVLDEILKKFQAVGELSEDKKNILIQSHKNVYNPEKLQVVDSDKANNFLNFMKTGEGNIQSKNHLFMIDEYYIVFGRTSDKHLLVVVDYGRLILRILK